MSALPPIADIGTESRNVRFVPKAAKRSARIRAAAGISTLLLAAPFETDRKDESEIGIGNGGRRWRQWGRTCDQRKRLGIEYRRAGTLDDLTVQHVTLPIDTEAEISDARRALGLRRIALEARQVSHDRLLPAGNCWSQLR